MSRADQTRKQAARSQKLAAIAALEAQLVTVESKIDVLLRKLRNEQVRVQTALARLQRSL